MLVLRKWFNPDNYDALLNLTVEELWQEFRYREQMFSNRKFSLGDRADTVNEKQEELIFAGRPLLTASLASEQISNPCNYLENDQHITHLPVRWLYQVEGAIRESGLVPYSADGRPKTDEAGENYSSYQAAWIWSKKNERLKSRLLLHINLRGSTDDEILESIRYLLPKWRKTTGVQPLTKEQTFYFGEVMIKKLVDFRIIPMLDLLYWSERNEIKLSDAELSGLLYRVGIDVVRGDSQIKETDKPMALKAKTREFDNLFTSFLYKNRYLMDMKVSALIDKINEDQKSKKKSRDERIN